MASSSSDDSVGQPGKDSCGDLGATPGRTFKGGKAVPKAFIMNPWHSGVRISVVCGEAKPTRWIFLRVRNVDHGSCSGCRRCRSNEDPTVTASQIFCTDRYSVSRISHGINNIYTGAIDSSGRASPTPQKETASRQTKSSCQGGPTISTASFFPLTIANNKLIWLNDGP